MSIVFFVSGLDVSTALSNINPAAFTWDPVNTSLGGRATLLMLCLASILLSRPHVVWVYSMYAVDMGLSLVLAITQKKAYNIQNLVKV